MNADQLEIKVAQGAKPGEGGQLPEVLRWWCEHPLTFARSFRGAPWFGARHPSPARARPVPCAAAPRPGGVRRFRPPPAAPAPPGPGLATGGERFSPRRPPGAPAPEASAGGAAPGSGAPAAAVVVVAVVVAGGPPWTGGGAPAPAPVPVRSPSPVVFAALMVLVSLCWVFLRRVKRGGDGRARGAEIWGKARSPG